MATTETTREQREAVIVALVGEHDPKLRYPAWQRWIDTGDEEPRDPTNKYDGPPPRAVRLAALLASHTVAAVELANVKLRTLANYTEAVGYVDGDGVTPIVDAIEARVAAAVEATNEAWREAATEEHTHAARQFLADGVGCTEDVNSEDVAALADLLKTREAAAVERERERLAVVIDAEIAEQNRLAPMAVKYRYARSILQRVRDDALRSQRPHAGAIATLSVRHPTPPVTMGVRVACDGESVSVEETALRSRPPRAGAEATNATREARPRCTTCGDSGWSIDDESNRRRCSCAAAGRGEVGRG